MHVIYIDDEDSEISLFRASFLLGSDAISITGLKPSYSLEETYGHIISEGDVDAVITDYELSDGCDVSFTGADLVQHIIENKPFLPCFILTAFEDNAVKSDSVDVYHVYAKSTLREPAEGHSQHEVSFLDRVTEQIEKSRRKLLKVEDEYNVLLSQRNAEGWTSENEDKLLAYDELLERHYGGSRISSVLKKGDYSNKVIELINVTKELLQEVRNNGSNT